MHNIKNREEPSQEMIRAGGGRGGSSGKGSGKVKFQCVSGGWWSCRWVSRGLSSQREERGLSGAHIKTGVGQELAPNISQKRGNPNKSRSDGQTLPTDRSQSSSKMEDKRSESKTRRLIPEPRRFRDEQSRSFNKKVKNIERFLGSSLEF